MVWEKFITWLALGEVKETWTIILAIFFICIYYTLEGVFSIFLCVR